MEETNMPQAKWLGIDITTTEMAVAVSDGSDDGFAAQKMRGATFWNENAACPGFDLRAVPGMLLELLRSLAKDGWSFDRGGSLSIACRQHDMVVLDSTGSPLLPALSWQCNAATREVEELNEQQTIVMAVGRVEERFILPKLMFVLRARPDLASQIKTVTTTGDWVLGVLASSFRLSTSDALSNGLLEQKSRRLANEVIRQAGVDPNWFPEVIQSGHEIGVVQAGAQSEGEWPEIVQLLDGWRVVAGLGDNHASALGCGMRDARTMVISAGTSGTVNLACAADAVLNEVVQPAARFEFYREQSLLLRMLPFCGDWYNRFLGEFCQEFANAHDALNAITIEADPSRVRRIECDRLGECYRAGWTRLSQAEQVASVQYSIATELLLHVKRVLAELPTARANLAAYVLTGGLSQSLFFQRVFAAGIELLDPGKRVNLSGRSGPLRYKTSASGALLNARLPEWEHDPANIPSSVFPVAECAADDDDALKELLRRSL
jgi:sugar (pentulose or hexulose) kinase